MLNNSLPCCVQVTGGRNGFGAKLTNIFSTEFTVETCDGQRGRKYKQVLHLYVICCVSAALTANMTSHAAGSF